MTVSERKSAAQFATSEQHPSQKESRPAGEASPVTSSKAASTSSSKSNRVDKATCSSKDEAQSRPSRRDQGCTTSTKQAGTMSRSTKNPQRSSPEQVTGLKASIPKVFKVQCFESDDSDQVDDPDCARVVNDVDSEPLQRVIAADSGTVGKADRSGRNDKHSGKIGIKRHGSVAVQVNKDSKKPKPQDTSGEHQKKDACKKVPAGSSQQKVDVPSPSGSVTGKAEQRGRQFAAPSGSNHVIADPLRSFREPVARQEGSSYKCCVQGCPFANGQDEVGVWLFALPCQKEEPSLRSAWLEGVTVDVEANRPQSPRVCFRHFDSAKDFVTLRHRVRGLDVNAVPSIQIPVPKVNRNPFVQRNLQMQNRTGRSNTGCGLAANSTVGSNTPRQEAQATMATSSALGSKASRYSKSVANFTKVKGCTVAETTGKSLRATPLPIDAVSPSSSSMTETPNKVTADHTEGCARTVTGTTGETLHAAPGPKGTVSLSVSLRTETPEGAAVESSGVGAEIVVETTVESVHAPPETRGAGSPSAISMTETPKQVTSEYAEVSVQTAMETGKSLHAAPQVVGAISPSSNSAMETPRETVVNAAEDSAHTVMGMTKHGLNSAPQSKEATSTISNSTAEALIEATSEPDEVNARTVRRKKVGTLNVAREPEDAISVSGSVSLMADTSKEAPAKPIEFSAHILSPAATKSSDIAVQPIEAIGCCQSSAAATHKSPDTSKLTPDAHTVVQLTEEDSDVVSLTQNTTGNGDTVSGLEMEDSSSSPIECTFSTSCESVSAESKSLQPSNSGAKQPSSDSKSGIPDCRIVQLSPDSAITLSSDEDDSRPGSKPNPINLIDDTVQTRVSNKASVRDTTSSPVPARLFVCKLERVSSDVSDDTQAATSSQNSSSGPVSCVGLEARASAERSDTSTPVTVSLNSFDERSSPSLVSDAIEKTTRDTEAGGHKLPPLKRHTESSAAVHVSEPPATPFSIVRDWKQKASVTVGPQRHRSSTNSGTFGRSASMRESCNSAATAVMKEKTRCPPCDGRDALSRAVAKKTGTAPSRPTSFDRQRLQKAGGAVATHCTSVQKHSSDASVSTDVDGTGSSGPEGGGEVTLFDPSQGRYIIEREVLGDEEEFGMHAISFRVDWVFTGSRPTMSRGPSSLQ